MTFKHDASQSGIIASMDGETSTETQLLYVSLIYKETAIHACMAVNFFLQIFQSVQCMV